MEKEKIGHATYGNVEDVTKWRMDENGNPWYVKPRMWEEDPYKNSEVEAWC
jgi:hypothetical protein